jgi:hypothetical protein
MTFVIEKDFPQITKSSTHNAEMPAMEVILKYFQRVSFFIGSNINTKYPLPGYPEGV